MTRVVTRVVIVGRWVVSDLVEALDGLVGELLAEDLHSLSPAELSTRVCRLQAVRSRFEVVMAETTRAADQAQVALLAGRRATPAFVASRTGVPTRRVRHDLTLGRRLADLDVLRDAVVTGLMTVAQFDVLTEIYRTVRLRPQLLADQELFVKIAVHLAEHGLGHHDWVTCVREWMMYHDQDGNEPREQQRSRGVTLTKQFDGTYKLTGTLTPDAGTIVANALAQHAQRVTDRELAELRKTQPDAPAADLDTTETQRRHDALVELAGHGAATAAGGAPPRPLAHLVMSLAIYEAAMAQADNPEIEIRIDHTDPDRRCQLSDGTILHPHTALRLLATATLTRLVIDAPSRILDLGRTVRAFPNHLRDAIIAAANGRCDTKGCDAPTHTLQIDHTRPWARGGPTNTDNATPQCGPDNRWRNHPQQE